MTYARFFFAMEPRLPNTWTDSWTSGLSCITCIVDQERVKVSSIEQMLLSFCDRKQKSKMKNRGLKTRGFKAKPYHRFDHLDAFDPIQDLIQDRFILHIDRHGIQ